MLAQYDKCRNRMSLTDDAPQLMEALREGYATAEIVTLPIITPDTSFT